MKKLLFLPVLFLLSIEANAQAPYIQWQKSFGGSMPDEGRYIVQTTDSGYIVAGVSGSNDFDVSGNNGPYDTWVAKLTQTGAISWQKCYGGSKSDNCNFIQQTADGGYIFASSSKSNDSDATVNHGKFDFWIVKLNATGGIVWQKSFGGSETDPVHCVKQTSDGGYIAVGRTESADGDVTLNHGGFDFWVIRLSSTGSLLWQKTYGGTDDDDAGGVTELLGGGFVIAGTTLSNDGDVTGNHGGEDIWVIRIDNTGGLVWQKCLGGTGDDLMIVEAGGSAEILQNSDSTFTLAGWSDSNDGDVTGNHGNEDGWVAKLTSAGGIIWQKSYGGTSDDELSCIKHTPDGGYIASGFTLSNDGDVSGNHGQYDYWIIKISDTGALQWQKCLGGTGAAPGDVAMSIQPTMGGGYIVAGLSNANDGDVTGNHGDLDYWVIKLNCTMPTVSSITGPTSVCAGTTITLTDATAGGTWRSGTGKASVNSSGVVTGITAGMEVISYSVANTCGAVVAIYNITVNPLPAPVITIAGPVLSTTTTYVTYQWIHNSIPVSGATNATYTLTASGTYQVVVTDANGCSAASFVHSFIPARVNNIYEANDMTIQPNPTTGIVTVSGVDAAGIKVYNCIGVLVKEANSDNISIAEYPTGLYFIRVFDTEGLLIKQEKVIKY